MLLLTEDKPQQTYYDLEWKHTTQAWGENGTVIIKS